jgi:O-antigen/teichoic acid export membrane protein
VALNKINQFVIKFGFSSLKLNVFSNLTANLWIAFIGIIFVPINLQYLGVEAYGIIGVFTVLQSFVWLFDFGLSATLNRELAHLSPHSDKAQEMHNLKRTIEIINWMIGISLASSFFILSPFIVKYWVNIENLPIKVVTESFMIMSVGFAVQWALGLYFNGLMGLQKHPLLNLINVVCATIRSIGAIAVLSFISTTIQAFLIWQTLIGVVQVVLLALILQRSLPAAPLRAKFDWQLIRRSKRFAAGMTGLSILGLIAEQTDKIILSKFLTLEYFGYYTLASTVTTTGILMIARSIASAIYPRFSNLISNRDEEAVKVLYHRSSQILAVLVFPATLVLTVFSFEILLVWTRNETTANNTWLLLTLLAIAAGINSTLNLPYYMQLAYGWTKPTFYTALAMLLLLTPVMLVAVIRYGAVGGAASWLLLNLVHFIATVHIMHTRILPSEKWRWYLQDLAIPFTIALTTTMIGRLFLGAQSTTIVIISIVAITLLVSYTFAALSTTTTRGWLQQIYAAIVRQNLLKITQSN